MSLETFATWMLLKKPLKAGNFSMWACRAKNGQVGTVELCC